MFRCAASRFIHSCVRQAAMDLRSLVGCMEAIVPSTRAESWDNVGLLVEPSGNPSISCVLLTIDLTERVLREAKEVGAGLIIAYHPPLFRPLTRLTQSSVKQRVIVQMLEAGVAVYSPHTALDSMEGGVNDWLVSGLGPGKVQALTTHLQTSKPDHLLSLQNVEMDKLDQLNLPETAAIKPSPRNPKLQDIEWPCTKDEVASLLLQVHTTIPLCQLSLHTQPQIPVAGCGRKITLDQPVSLFDLVTRVKSHLSLLHVRLATPDSWTDEYEVATVAVCAGSGAKVLHGARADVYLTGEMGHHEVLAATSQGTAVILCEHSNSERGFLQVYLSLLQARTGPDITIVVANSDSDPLVIA